MEKSFTTLLCVDGGRSYRYMRSHCAADLRTFIWTRKQIDSTSALNANIVSLNSVAETQGGLINSTLFHALVSNPLYANSKNVAPERVPTIWSNHQNLLGSYSWKCQKLRVILNPYQNSLFSLRPLTPHGIRTRRTFKPFDYGNDRLAGEDFESCNAWPTRRIKV